MTTRRTFSRATAGLLFLGVAVILCVAALVFRGIQKNSVPRRQFVEIKAKAEEGDAQAQANLGDQYFFGEGTAKDRAEAVKWWRKAAEKGDGKSQFSLAFCYFQGLGVEKDVAQAMKWYQSFTNHGINIAGAAARLNAGVE